MSAERQPVFGAQVLNLTRNTRAPHTNAEISPHSRGGECGGKFLPLARDAWYFGRAERVQTAHPGVEGAASTRRVTAPA